MQTIKHNLMKHLFLAAALLSLGLSAKAKQASSIVIISSANDPHGKNQKQELGWELTKHGTN